MFSWSGVDKILNLGNLLMSNLATVESFREIGSAVNFMAYYSCMQTEQIPNISLSNGSFVGATSFFIAIVVSGMSYPFLVTVGITPYLSGIITAGIFIGVAGFRVLNQYERGVILTLGKYSGTKDPGLRWILIGIQKMTIVDLRTKVVDVPDQDCITKDNVSLNVNAVLYYMIDSAEKTVLEVENYSRAVSQLAQTTMRDVVGEVTLDDLLTQRDTISSRIKDIVDKVSDKWGIKVESVDLKHIELPENMKRTMGKEAEAERERRAVIIKAEGEKTAAENLSLAAKILSGSSGALHLRTLHSINDVSSDQSNTIIFTLPVEMLKAFQNISEKGEEK